MVIFWPRNSLTTQWLELTSKSQVLLASWRSTGLVTKNLEQNVKFCFRVFHIRFVYLYDEDLEYNWPEMEHLIKYSKMRKIHWNKVQAKPVLYPKPKNREMIFEDLSYICSALIFIIINISKLHYWISPIPKSHYGIADLRRSNWTKGLTCKNSLQSFLSL